MKIHELADVQSKNIGSGTVIWQFAVILPGAVVGENCNINCHTFIENDVIIGKNVTIKSGTFLWDGTRIEDDVFVGPNVTFVNNNRVRNKRHIVHPPIIVKQGASLGANSSILAGITIGRYAMTGMSSVITKDVPDHALVFGHPAQIIGWVDEEGRKLKKRNDNEWISESGDVYISSGTGLAKLHA
jgi:UDP-2-acetamido-3-amino-2,3-dideoxy-glucuronate N-acetyltransferase